MKNVLWRSIIVGIIFITGAIWGYQVSYKDKQLPILLPRDINPQLVDKSVLKKKEHQIGEYLLYDQDADQVTPENFEGVPYVANFIFTTCPDMCPRMSNNLSVIYQKFKGKNVKFLSHSVTPKIDTTAALKAYAIKHGVNDKQWLFVRGEKKLIYDLARKHYFAATTEGNGDEYDFIHTENFVLIDQQKRIRGIYNGLSFEELDQLEEDIEVLMRGKDGSHTED